MSDVRLADTADAEAIAAIQNDVIRNTTITFTTQTKSPSDIEDLMLRHPYFVLDRGGVFGFATFGPFRSGPGYGRVREHSIYLSPAQQGHGQGAVLLGALEGHARNTGIETLVGGISSENQSGLAFHLKHGFREVGRMPEIGQKFGRKLGLVLVQKSL